MRKPALAAIVLTLTCLALVGLDRGFGLLFPAYPVYLNKHQYSWDSYATNDRGYFDVKRVGPDGKTYFTIDRTGEWPLRTPAQSGFEPGAVQLMGIGDSFTYAQGVRLRDTWIMRLEHAHARRPIHSINLGSGGADVRAVLAALKKKIGDYRPSLVVYGYVLNDPVVNPDNPSQISHIIENPLMTSDKDSGWALDLVNLRAPVIRSLRAPFAGWLGDHSRIVDYALSLRERSELSARTLQFYRDLHDPLKNRLGLKETFDDIREMKRLATSAGGRFLVAIFPIFYHVGGASYPLTEVHESLVRTLGTAGIETVDLRPAYEGRRDEELWVHPADQHPNDLAQKIAAEEIEKWIRKNSSLLD